MLNLLFLINCDFILLVMSGKGPHIVRTALQQRHRIMYSANIKKIQRLSSTVKGLELKVNEPSRKTFKAGQWVDFFAPGISHIGGFSMYSAPYEFRETGIIQLAVKLSEDPVVRWIHEKCSVNDDVHIRFGGDIYYDPESDPDNHSLCLIAGGIGINPLLSIIRETLQYDEQKGIKRLIYLLQSAKNEEELLFEKESKLLSQRNPTFTTKLFVTDKSHREDIINRRINKSDLQTAVDQCGHKTKYFVCGPTIMITEIEQDLVSLGIEKSNIYFEKWS